VSIEHLRAGFGYRNLDFLGGEDFDLLMGLICSVAKKDAGGQLVCGMVCWFILFIYYHSAKCYLLRGASAQQHNPGANINEVQLFYCPNTRVQITSFQSLP